MTKTTTVASKAFVAIVAAAMVFSLIAPAAKAATAEELQAQITALMAQIAALQGGTTTTTTTTTSTCAAIPAPLTMNASGASVTALQNFLIGAGQSIPAGATGFFGAQTRSALAAWQSANGVSPAAGYYGPITAAAIAAKCVPTTPTTPGTTPTTPGGSTADLEGEASLDSADLEDGESTIEEGDEEAEIGQFMVEFTDGDAEISRIDVALTATGADAWDAFETISLWVDGKMVAEVDAADEDDYLDEDAGELRFSDLNIVAMEDEELEITIGATVQSSLDAEELTDWNLEVTSMRFFDADGVAETEIDPADPDTVSFEIQEAGTDEELDLSLASSNPDSTDIIVDTDADTNDVTIMVGEIEAQDNDIELNTIVVKIDTTGGYSTTSVEGILDEVRLVIDGEEFDAEAIGTESDSSASTDTDPATGLADGFSERASATSSVWYYFDIDGDIVVDEDGSVEMEVVVDFNDTDDSARYPNGTTIKASVTSVETAAWDAEGADDLVPSSQIDGTMVGDMHTLVAEGILVPVDGFTSTVDTLGTNDNIGEFTLEFEVTAVEDDFYITENASQSAITDGVRYTVDGTVGSGTVSAVLTSTADEDTPNIFTVREGETETFTLTVTIDPQAAGSFRVQLDEIRYSTATNGLGGPAYLPTPVSDFRTASKAIGA